jgi:hypothetical protein
MATMSAANRARSVAMQGYWARKRFANEHRSDAMFAYWDCDTRAPKHRRTLSRAMKAYWRTKVSKA